MKERQRGIVDLGRLKNISGAFLDEF